MKSPAFETISLLYVNLLHLHAGIIDAGAQTQIV